MSLEFDMDEIDIDYDDDANDHWNELLPEGQRYQACYGTGLDDEYDVDCLICYGEGYI